MLDQAKQRRRLERMLNRLGRRHESLSQSRWREEDQDPEEAEEESDSTSAALQEESEGQGQRVHKALERLAAGSYGVCEDCEQEIGTARLQALPYAVTCIACARERERQGAP